MRMLDDFFPQQQFFGGPEAVTPDEIIAFASRYDPQYFHLDAEAAQNSLFGGLAASGWLTASLTMRMLVASQLDIQGGMIGREVESIRWPRPVYPGDVLRTVTTVLEVIPSRSRADRGTVRIQTETFNQRDELVQNMSAALFMPRRIAQEG